MAVSTRKTANSKTKMNIRKLGFGLLSLVVLFSACQQRYAHIPKVKVQPEAKLERNKELHPVTVPSITPSIHYEANAPVEASHSINSELYPSEETRINIPVDSTTADSLQADLAVGQQPINDEPIRLTELEKSDRVAITSLITLALLLSFVTIFLILLIPKVTTIYIGSIFIGFPAGLFLASLAIPAVIILLTLLYSRFIVKGYLGTKLEFGDLFVNVLVVLLGIFLLTMIHHLLASVVIVLLAVMGLSKLIRGSKLKSKS
ncbi:MAG: hypothetical protein EP332_07175 [Bacteroidetes bacterium]|nr:MAG: hypothetical protein EP332_07175 [Bacteroidota bacterium]